MNLAWKLFVSYLGVVIVGALVLAAFAALYAPVSFSSHMRDMDGAMSGMSHTSTIAPLETELDANFRQAVNSALLLSAVVATVAAGIVSAYMSRRIVLPIRETVRASQRIAAGHYDERIIKYSDDEIGVLTESFNQMAAALARTETIRQQLIADISHELKTPLASIKAYMEGLEDGILHPTLETFQQVHREADRLERLVFDLRQLSHAEAGQMRIEKKPCDIGELAESVVDWMHPQFNDAEVELRGEMPTEPLVILADYDRIRQVLLNLLGNALQYTPSGGSVTLRINKRRADVQVAVQDTGTGLATDELELIFQRFYRVDKSRSRISGGSGIGLTIARHIVLAHDGFLWAESPGANQGSTFYFTLPFPKYDPATQAIPSDRLARKAFAR